MVNWTKAVSNVMGNVNSSWDTAKDYVTKTLGIQDPIRIMPYWGYGTFQKLYLKGRVLQDEGISLREENAPLWKNLLNMYRRFETDEVPGVQVQIKINGQKQCVTTNQEGFFDAEFNLLPSLETDSLWQSVQLEILSDHYPVSSPTTQTEAIIVSDRAKFGVISDIDDTIMHTAATDLLKMIRIAYLGNERTRRPFEGVAQFYQALQSGQLGNSGNPIFYVSSSAWNMYDLFAKFIEFNNLPKGPFLLRDIELAPDNLLSFEHSAHKLEQICPILEQLPDLPFILIGDTGQQDADIYRQIAQNYPGRVLAVYLRNVTPDDTDRLRELAALNDFFQQQGIAYLIFPHTLTAMHHAANQGWINKP